MTNDEIMMFLRKAQEQQAKAFPTKKVSYYLQTNYTPSTGGTHFIVSIFYGQENKMFYFYVGHHEDIEEVSVNFRIADTIIDAASSIENQ